MENDFFLEMELFEVTNKDEVLERLSVFLSSKMKADSKTILNSIRQREEVSNTGLEKGVAVPHAFIPGIREAHICIVRCNNEIPDWYCVDGSLVSLVLCMVLPESYDAATKGVEILIQIFRQLAHTHWVEEIQKITSSKEIADQLSKSVKGG